MLGSETWSIFRQPPNYVRFGVRLVSICILFVLGRYIHYLELDPTMRAPLHWIILMDGILTPIVVSLLALFLWDQRGGRLQEYPFSAQYHRFPPIDWGLVAKWIKRIIVFLFALGYFLQVLAVVAGFAFSLLALLEMVVTLSLSTLIVLTFFFRHWSVEK